MNSYFVICLFPSQIVPEYFFSQSLKVNIDRKMVIAELLRFIPDVAMVFGGVLPYVPQYAQIRETKSTGSFSTHVSNYQSINNVNRIFLA